MASVLGCGFAAAVHALLQRGIFSGQAQSFDLMLYARSLWGVAHGTLWNPVLDEPVFVVHMQLMLWPLAPWLRWFRAADVLVCAQAAAYGVSIALLTAAFVREWPRTHPGERALVGLVVACVFGLGSPLWSNPVLFDARPEVLGVPCLTWALLRAVRAGGVDRVGLLALFAASAAREEFALASGMALWLLPVRSERVRRGLWGLLFCSYFVAVYLFAHRGLASQQLHLAADELSASERIAYKSAWLCVALATGGGLALRGFRWLGAALPGALFVLGSSWLAREQLSLHYGMFAVPALSAAAYAGYRRVLTQARAPLQLGLHAAIAAACYLFASAWPGGALFARDYFDVSGPPLMAASYRQHSAWLRDVHATLARIPAERALLVPYMFGAPLADRPVIRSFERDGASQAQHPSVDTVALLRKDWFRYAPPLRRQGFELSALSGTNLAVLSRLDPAMDLRTAAVAARCDAVALRWPAAGLGLCNIWLGEDGRVNAVFVRLGAADASAGEVVASVTGDHTSEQLELWPLDGLVRWSELPKGLPLLARTPTASTSARVRLLLRTQAGALAAAETTRDPAAGIVLQLLADRGPK